MYDYQENGVKIRADGAGDAWAKQHRELGTGYSMHDIDALMGHMAFAQNSGDKFFLEYEPDDYKNRGNTIRRFAIVALFDRKQSEYAAINANNTLSTAIYLYMARAIANSQPVAPKFFYVIGTQEPPWELMEIDINTASIIKRGIFCDGHNWKDAWESAGLVEMRRELCRWIYSKEQTQ